MTVVVWWKYTSNNTESWLQAAHTNEKRAIIAELFMPMMQSTIKSLSTFEVKYDLRHKIRSLFCNGLSTFIIIWPKKIELLIMLPCGSYCFVHIVLLMGLWSLIVVFTGHPQLHSDKIVRMYR